MKHLRISYSIWSDLIFEHPMWDVFYVEKTTGLAIFTGHEGVVYESFTSDSSVFLVNYPDAIEVGIADDALALLSTTIIPDKRDEKGHLIIAPTYFTINESWRMEGIRYTASGNAITMYDFRITKEILVQGGLWWVTTTGNSDTCDFSIIDKDNILGLHTLYGLPPGHPIELKKFIKSYSIPPGTNTGQIQAPTVSPVVSGLYIRTAYDNNGDDPAEIGVNYIWYEKA